MIAAGQRNTFHSTYAAIRTQAAFPAATIAVQGNVIREGAAAPRKAASTKDASADLIFLRWIPLPVLVESLVTQALRWPWRCSTRQQPYWSTNDATCTMKLCMCISTAWNYLNGCVHPV